MFSLRRKTPLSIILAATALIASGPHSFAHTLWPRQGWHHGFYRPYRVLPPRVRHAIHPLRDARPNPSLTPGALNPAVTQADIHQTICVPDASAQRSFCREARQTALLSNPL